MDENIKVIKKFTAIKLQSTNIDNEEMCRLSFGEITGPYYSKSYPEKEFDTEDEATEYAFNQDKYVAWLILPIIRFKED